MVANCIERNRKRSVKTFATTVLLGFRVEKRDDAGGALAKFAPSLVGKRIDEEGIHSLETQSQISVDAAYLMETPNSGMAMVYDDRSE
jgi:hypothetical protein